MKKIDITLEDDVLRYLKFSETKSLIEYFFEQRNIKDYKIIREENNKILLKVDKKAALETTLKSGSIFDNIISLMKAYNEAELRNRIEELKKCRVNTLIWGRENFDEYEDENS